MFTHAADIRYLRPGDVTIDDTNLFNSYSLIFIRVPIATGNNESLEKVINRLRLINKEIDIAKNSMEYQVG